MLLSSVILVLQETLEGALLASVLMALGFRLRMRMRWLPIGLCLGALLAWLYAANMGAVSEWFDYVGQEVVNALMQITIAMALVILTWGSFRKLRSSVPGQVAVLPLLQWCAMLAITLAITREGAEVLTYLGGVLHQADNLQAVMTGSAIGFSIGISVAALLFYGLVGLKGKWGMAATLALLALIAGNMLCQAALQLTQADWISSTGAVWDTSSWWSEESITGQLLYALIGYEATPSPVQVASYVAGVLLVLLAAAAGRKMAVRV